MTAPAPARRGATDRNARGSASDRRARKRYLLDTFGDGETCTCSHCPAILTEATVTVDRIVPGVLGGSYRRGNIRPACGPCNSRLGGRRAWTGVRT